MGSVSSEEKYVEGIQEEDEAFSLAMTVVTGAVPTIVLQAATELGLLEIIKKAGSGAFMSASEIALELPNNRNKDAAVVLDRMLSLLASYSIISCSVRTTLPDGNVERLYGLAPPCKFLTKNEDGDSLGVFFPTMKLLLETSAHFKDVVLYGGTAFEKTFGMTIFERMEREPSFNKFFNDVMASNSRIIIRKLVDSYEGFKNLSSLVDVAGGTGATLRVCLVHGKLNGKENVEERKLKERK